MSKGKRLSVCDSCGSEDVVPGVRSRYGTYGHGTLATVMECLRCGEWEPVTHRV